MPARIRIVLEGPNPPGPHRHADGLRAVVLGAIQRANPELGTWLHDANQPKPIAIGPLQPFDGRDGMWAVEVSALADDLIEPLMAGLPSVGASVRLGRTGYLVRDVGIVETRGFEEMAEATNPQPVIRLRIITPTAHHAAGAVRRSIVVPDPRLYIGSWLGRWNLFADAPYDLELLEAVADSVVVSAFAGRTRAERLDGRRIFIGFVGSVEFRVLDCGRPIEPIAAAVWSLARFAEFSGTGVETMRGMGQTRIAEE